MCVCLKSQLDQRAPLWEAVHEQTRTVILYMTSKENKREDNCYFILKQMFNGYNYILSKANTVNEENSCLQ